MTAPVEVVDLAVEAAPRVICAVRDFDQEAVAESLEPLSVVELRALVVVLAAAIDPETTCFPAALHWTEGDAPKPRNVPMRHRRKTIAPAETSLLWTAQEISKHRAELAAAIYPGRR